ncbi:MAG: potassium-transporting ATPase subunit KdpC [Burkholderiales bacterium]|nr:potassium-transporting ATPase subunit KdpC [Burkholderiales bacterium]
MSKVIRPLLVSFVGLSLLTGLAYPLVTAGIGKVLFPKQAEGSLIRVNGEVVGSSLIGQNFSSPKYFWGRLSATSPQPYNGLASGGSSTGPTNPALIDEVKGRMDALHQADPNNKAAIPVDLVTSSGSGLDPEISIAAAQYQVGRVARERKLNESVVQGLVAQYTSGRQLGVLGEPRVNVLKLNLALDGMTAE